MVLAGIITAEITKTTKINLCEGTMSKRLCKSRTNVMIDGVCGGIAEYFNIDATLVRLGVLAAIFFTGVVPGLFIYLGAAVVMPRDQRYIQ